MLLRLEAIKFNHDTSGATTDAINIRRNETEFVAVPEWLRDVSISPEHSPAAYALCETSGRVLTIQAKFSCDQPVVQSVEIRALDARLHPARGFSFYWSAHVVGLLRPVLRGLVGNVLGEVEARRIPPCEGETDFVTFELKDVRIWDVGVGVHDVAWRWQYRVGPADEWVDIATSAHRIYTLLGVPTEPWQQQPYASTNTQLPWAEVLDRACVWAARANHANDAAALVTRRVNDLGAGVLSYNGSAYYTDAFSFDCNSFLGLLRGEVGRDPYVNCDDCAAITVTFANVVGCGLSQSCITPIKGKFTIRVKPILLIGLRDWKFNFEFVHHRIASEGQCREDDEVFDASLHVDGDDNPATVTALLATNLRFGTVGERGFRFRLVLPEAEPTSVPHPNACQRRRIGAATRPDPDECTDPVPLRVHYDFAAWERSKAAGTRLFVLEFFFADYVLPGWRPIRLRQSAGGEEPAIQSYWESEQGGAVLRADVYERASWQEARKTVMALLTRFQTPGMRRRGTPELGDVSFADPELNTVLFATGNLVFQLRNAGRDLASWAEVAERINQNILNLPPGRIDPIEFRPDGVFRFRFERDKAFINDEVRINRSPAAPLARRRFYQFFTDNGEVSRQGARLVYRPQIPELNTLEIFAVDERGDALKQVLDLEVEGAPPN